ncbi:MAG: hypothetical protein AAF684_07890 [Pseudomonadota bacterium]
MTVTNELMFEMLKTIQATLAEHGRKLDEMRSSLTGIQTHLHAHQTQIGGLMLHDSVQDGAVASIRARLDRIERRLEINEA